MQEISQKLFSEERALYGSRNVKVSDCVFERGESPVKECENVELECCRFSWKYPIWYSKNISVRGTTWDETARAGVWYNENVSVTDAYIQAPKNFRRCKRLILDDVCIPNAEETLWHCDGVKIKRVSANGHYFGMNCRNVEADGLKVNGNYVFDGLQNAVIRNSRLITKDSFWNSENVTVYDSFITGEYLGWNSKNLTLINCTVESLQGMCYIDNLVMKNCKLINTTLAFEYSTVEAEISSRIDSVLNPKSGTITAPSIGELIIERDHVDPSKIRIVCDDVATRTDKLDWTKIDFSN